ncbi:hypothetical protein PLEOSDRAFT_177271 [Pleurotus ostreatus PC15]|uniref:Uncharacterized protein n=1 Tax=Pleurotus ostreatus (strain PC15) TaxID=1137138 RepID=A0A067NF33_PLEO1|nr:hypothetical protein PLEOSDRAFT_177271 [Pleurotus ostreatus PC15]
MQYQTAILVALTFILPALASSPGGVGGRRLPNLADRDTENVSESDSHSLFSVRAAQVSCGSIQVHDKTADEQAELAAKGCIAADSKGLKSSHNCFNKGGNAYFCNPSCFSKSQMKKLSAENGECFV